MPGEQERLPAPALNEGPAGGDCSERPARTMPAALALALVLLTSGSSAPAFSSAAREETSADTGRTPIEFSRRVLDSGLTVLLAEEHSLPLVSVLAWYRTGARHEVAGITGIAHYLEHMAFRDTENVPPGDVTGLIERLGGHWHGYTRLDNTTYYETARREALDWLLFLEADRMQSCRILPQEVEVERGSVLSELKGYENEPWSLLFDDVAAVAFREHPYRLNIVGWVSDLEAITHGDLVEFYEKHYVPANAVLAVVGDFNAEQAWSVVRRAFGKLPTHPAPEPLRTREPPQRGEKRVTLSLPGSSPSVLIAHHAPAFNDPNYYAFLLLDGLLSGGRSPSLLDDGFVIGAQTAERRTSRLFRDVVEKGLATRLTTGLLPSLHPYLYSITAEAAPGVSVDRLESAILTSLESLSASPPPADELERVRERLGNLMRLETDTYQEVAHVRAGFEALGAPGDWELFEKRLMEVTPESVQAVARRSLGARNRTVGIFTPQEIAPSGAGMPTTGASAEAGEAPDTRSKNRSSPERRASPGRIHPPRISLEAIPAPPAFSEKSLATGLTLFAAQNPWVSTASLVAEIDAGPVFDPASQRGVAALTARLLAFGSAGLGAVETAERIDRLGMRWRVRVGGSDITFPDPRKVRIELEFAARDLERAAGLLADALRAPLFPRAPFRNARQAQINAAAALGDDAGGLAWNGLWSALYSGSAWGEALPVSGQSESLSSLGVSDLRAFHRRYYRPERTLIAFGGGVRAAEALQVLASATTEWAPPAASGKETSEFEDADEQALPRDEAPDRRPPEERIARLDHKTRVEIAYGFFTGIESGSSDFRLFEALWYAVQHGYYAGRLGDRIVGQRGLAYSLESHHAPELPGAPMLMATGAPPEKVRELKRVWEATLDEVARDGITREELAAAKTYLQGRRLHERESNLSAARAALQGGGRAPTSGAPAQELTLERVNDLARRLLQNRRATWSLAGPAY